MAKKPVDRPVVDEAGVSGVGRGADQFPLRLPDGWRDKIKAWAAESGRSMNAEILHRLASASLSPESFEWLHSEVKRLRLERNTAEAKLRESMSNDSGRSGELVVTRLLAVLHLPATSPERQAAEWDAVAFATGFPVPAMDRFAAYIFTEEKLREQFGEVLEAQFVGALGNDLLHILDYLNALGWRIAGPKGEDVVKELRAELVK